MRNEADSGAVGDAGTKTANIYIKVAHLGFRRCVYAKKGRKRMRLAPFSHSVDSVLRTANKIAERQQNH